MSKHTTKYRADQKGGKSKGFTKWDIRGINKKKETIGEPRERPSVSPILYDDVNNEVSSTPVSNKTTKTKSWKIILSYIIIIVATLLFILFLMNDSLKDINEYTSGTGFVSSSIMLVCWTIILLIIGIVCYIITKKDPTKNTLVLFSLSIFLVSIIAWNYNFITRTIRYDEGITHFGHGGIFLILSLVSLLFLMYIASKISDTLGYIMIVPILWIMVLLYQWWFY